MLNLLLMFVGSEIDDLFNALFFGAAGGWIGFIILCAVMLVVTAKVKIACVPFSVVSIFMGIMMSNGLAPDSSLWWCCILYFTMPFFLVLLYMRKGSGGL